MSRATGDKHVLWLDRGWQPTPIGFAPSEAAWNREMRELGLTTAYPDSTGRATSFTHLASGGSCVLITFSREKFEGRTRIEQTGLVVHESVHVWQYICQNHGISGPDMETEAYAVMAITQNLLVAIGQAWGIDFNAVAP